MKTRNTLIILLLALFTSCDKDVTIPLRTDVVGYGNDFKLGVRMISWEIDQYTEVIGNDSINIRLTYVQVPDTLKVRSNGNRIIVYSNNKLCIDTSFSPPINIAVPIIN